MNILITGGTGFLGSHLVRHFVGRGFEVSVLARHTSTTKCLNDCQGRFNLLRYKKLEDISELFSSLALDCVIHTACRYGRAGEALNTTIFANLIFPLAVLEASISAGVTSFVNTGTILGKYLNTYSLSKAHFSEWGQQYVKQGSGQFVEVLLEHMYGPGDNITKFATYVVKSCMANVPMLELTAGEQKRDFIYIDDVVSAYSVIVDHLGSMGKIEQISVGSGYAGTIREFAEKIHHITASTTKLAFGALAYRENEMMISKANTEKLISLGWLPKYNLDAGIEMTIKMEKTR